MTNNYVVSPSLEIIVHPVPHPAIHYFIASSFINAVIYQGLPTVYNLYINIQVDNKSYTRESTAPTGEEAWAELVNILFELL